MGNCLFTDEEARIVMFPMNGKMNGNLLYKSEICGYYGISESLERFLKAKPLTDQMKAKCAYQCLKLMKSNPEKASFWVNKENENSMFQILKEENLDSNWLIYVFEDVINESVDHAEKPNDLLQILAQKLNLKGAFDEVSISKKDMLMARIDNVAELFRVVDYLENKNYLKVQYPLGDGGAEHKMHTIFNLKLRFNIQGWEEIKRRSAFQNTNKVLIAIQFIWPDEQELRQEVLLAIKEACKSNGYEADVVNQDHTGNVSDQIISDIKKSRFVVAELTYNNRGVYFEAGFSRGLGLPVFHLVRNGHIDGEDKEGKKVHFDIQQLMYRKWTNPEELKNGLKSWIAATVGPYEVK